MIFTSLDYIVFLFITIVLYYLMPSKFRWLVLLSASLFFYATYDIKFIPFIVLTSGISFSAAYIMSNYQEKAAALMESADSSSEKKEIKTEAKKKCKRVMLTAVILILAYLMYTKFALKIWNLFVHSKEPVFKVIVPLGISYYTFSTVGYILDIYWKRYKAEKNFFRYLLYVVYFPHILQGPIARYDRLGKQFSVPHTFDYTGCCRGAQLILWGFFQKLVIADRLSDFVENIFISVSYHGGAVLLLATFLYAIQLYADFDGCVNIARGTSSIFGIELEENFRRPYFSKSVEEYWRRWHMTLGAWFKDYLCMPVSVSSFVKNISKKVRNKWGNTAGKKTTSIIAVIAVWICTGVWHGTGLNYVLWGIWQGGIIIFSLIMDERFIKIKEKLKITDNLVWWRAFQMIRTFILTAIIPRIITRTNCLNDSLIIFKRILLSPRLEEFSDGALAANGLDHTTIVICLVGVIIWLVIAILKENGVHIRETIDKQFILVRWSIYLGAFFFVAVFGLYGPGFDAGSFVYMGF